MTAADKYPESVSRICDELQGLSNQMFEMRRTQPGFPTSATSASSGARDDSAMDVDQDEVLICVSTLADIRVNPNSRYARSLFYITEDVNRSVI